MKMVMLVGLLLGSSAITLHAQKQVVTAAQANGVYRSGKSEFRILALGRNKLKVHFDGVYMTVSGTPNMGYGSAKQSSTVTSQPSSPQTQPVAISHSSS
jgi:hypothetical protein